MTSLRFRAMDVRATIIRYIAVHIRRESRFGVVGELPSPCLKPNTNTNKGTWLEPLLKVTGTVNPLLATCKMLSHHSTKNLLVCAPFLESAL